MRMCFGYVGCVGNAAYVDATMSYSDLQFAQQNQIHVSHQLQIPCDYNVLSTISDNLHVMSIITASHFRYLYFGDAENREGAIWSTTPAKRAITG
jgi:hypothetical protein